MDWLTSDSHYAHSNIIKYCKRPFFHEEFDEIEKKIIIIPHTEEMNEKLIENTNRVVSENDRLFHLGDWAKKDVSLFRKAIRCKNVFLIRGNHDKMKDWEERLFSGVENLISIKTQVNGEDKEIVLCHYAMRVWNKSHHGVAHAWGHSHSTLPDDPNALSMDVGVDNIAKILSPDGIIRRPEDYRPISVVEFFDFMKKKTWKPVDHHGKTTKAIETW